MSAMLRSPSSLVDACFFEACCDAAWTPCADHDSVAVKANEPCDYVAPIRGDRALFMSGKIEMEALEAASRVAIHAFFREYSKTKQPWEVDALIARYESRGVGPRRLLQLVENAFNRGRARRRRLLALRASGAAPRAASETLYLENGEAGPRSAAATVSYRGLAATPHLFSGSPTASSPRTPPPPPGPDPSPAGSPATPRYMSPLPSPSKVPPPPSPPPTARRRSTVKVGRTTVNLSPTGAAAPPPASSARKAKKRGKKKKCPPRSAPGTGYALD